MPELLVKFVWFTFPGVIAMLPVLARFQTLTGWDWAGKATVLAMPPFVGYALHQLARALHQNWARRKMKVVDLLQEEQYLGPSFSREEVYCFWEYFYDRKHVSDGFKRWNNSAWSYYYGIRGGVLGACIGMPLSMLFLIAWTPMSPGRSAEFVILAFQVFVFLALSLQASALHSRAENRAMTEIRMLPKEVQEEARKFRSNAKVTRGADSELVEQAGDPPGVDKVGDKS